jgi:hypothetical protein
MGQKSPHRKKEDPRHRGDFPKSAGLKQDHSKLWVPAALLAGFFLGFVFARIPQDSRSGEEFTPESPSLVSAPLIQPTKKSSPTLPTQKTPDGKWDEKTIQALPLDEIKNRLRQLSSWEPGPRADQTERWLVQRWARLDPSNACLYAYQAVLQGADEYLLFESASLWAQQEPATAAKWAGNLGSPSLREVALDAVYRTWAKLNSAAAIKSISSLPSAATRAVATTSVAGRHAQNNFANALQWARKLPGPLREKTLEQILGEWTRRDPTGAAHWLIQQPGEIQWSLIGKLAGDWVRKDPATALAWGQGQSDPALGSTLAPGPVQRKFLDLALSGFISSDPRAAASWLVSPAGSKYFPARATSVASRWTSLDPKEAVAWAGSIPDEKIRKSALGTIAYTWVRTDPEAATQWVGSLPSSPTRDPILSSLSSSMAPFDPASAAYWASQISVQQSREGSLSGILQTWKKVDPSAALQFIRTTPALSEPTRANLLL